MIKKKVKNKFLSVGGAGRGSLPDRNLLVMTGTSCNNLCLFCSARSMRRLFDRSTAEIAAELSGHKGTSSRVEFIGGEFTIRPDAAALVRLCRRLGYRYVSLETNGKMFAYPVFAEDIVKAGLSHITFSLHGATARTHDRLTGSPGAFRQAMAGLRNAAALGADLSVNFVVTKLNYREIPAFARRVGAMKGVRNIRFSMVRPVEHFTEKDFFRLVPRFSAVLPYLEKALRCRKVSLFSVPPCLAPGERVEDHREKLAIKKNYGELSAPGNCYDSIREMLAYGRSCGRCSLKGACLGVWKKYLRHYGEGELKPLP